MGGLCCRALWAAGDSGFGPREVGAVAGVGGFFGGPAAAGCDLRTRSLCCASVSLLRLGAEGFAGSVISVSLPWSPARYVVLSAQVPGCSVPPFDPCLSSRVPWALGEPRM